jgi:hypothetical protein
MKPRGLSINIGIDDKFRFVIMKLPLLTIRPKYKKDGVLETFGKFGIRLDLMIGTLKRPIPKVFLKEFWLRNASRFGDPNYVRKESTINPWNSGNHWFVLKIPFCPGIFFSTFIKVGKNKQPGFYIGTKTYEVNKISSCLLDYAKQEYQTNNLGNPIYTWATREEQGSIYLCPSASIRSDLIEDK